MLSLFRKYSNCTKKFRIFHHIKNLFGCLNWIHVRGKIVILAKGSLSVSVKLKKPLFLSLIGISPSHCFSLSISLKFSHSPDLYIHSPLVLLYLLTPPLSHF